eukprot:COSAG06_NODE_44831_length_360_cov_0.616858_1_plen_67_part_10
MTDATITGRGVANALAIIAAETAGTPTRIATIRRDHRPTVWHARPTVIAWVVRAEGLLAVLTPAACL